MDASGRRYDIMIKYNTQDDDRNEWMFVWADAGYKIVIENVEGVAEVYNNEIPEKYVIHLDPRYKRSVVASAIIEAIQKV